MNKQLMWVSAVLPQDINNEIADICLQYNKQLKLSERFFKFPLHISLKRTFYTDDYDSVKKDLKELLDNNGSLLINSYSIIRNKDMLWIDITDNRNIKLLHEAIDQKLKEKYQIPIDEFDKNYYPHVTLFRDEVVEKLDLMKTQIEKLVPVKELIIDTFAMGTTLDNNEFYTLERK